MKITGFALSSSVVLLAGALAACQQAETPPHETETEMDAGPEAKPGLSLTEGTLLLPVVPGRPGAAYFALENNSDKTVTLSSVYVEGALKAEMHETKGGSMSPAQNLVLEPGQNLEFTRGGLHVMAFDLADDVAVGNVTEITLTFSDGDKLSAPLTIKSMTGKSMAGESSMEHMDHGDDH